MNSSLSTINEWNDSLKGDFLWNNANFGEAVTETMTPLAWSVLQFTLEDWVFLPGFSTTGNIGGRPYINISIFASLFHTLGRSRQDLLEAMESTLYMNLPEEMDIPLIPISWRALVYGVFNLIRTQIKQKQGVKRLPDYLAKNADWFKRVRARIQTELSTTGLLSLWHTEIGPHIKQGAWSVLGTANYSADYTLQLRRELTALVGPEDANALIANLSEHTELLPSLGPVVGLAKVVKGELSRDSYLEKFGHRGPNEFEISAPRPAEDPDWFDQQLAQFNASPVDIEGLLSKQRNAFMAAWQRLSSRHSHKADGILRHIKESARRTQLRESARSEYIRDRWIVRIFACRVGELTGLGEDIFFLTLEEVFDLLSGNDTVVQVIPTSRDIYNEYKALPPYPSLIRGRFDPFQWAADPNRRSDVYDAHTHHSSRTAAGNVSNTIRGAAGSAGRVDGLVRRLDNPREGDQLHPGEILVTKWTDISWTPIFPRAAAVVTDVGAPLSHAAIVARELGIPAVVGCGDATLRLKSGDRVRVDGSRGIVEILGSRLEAKRT